MKSNRLAVIILGSALVLSGCGPTKQELADKERSRLEGEERSRQETEAANKAITRMNQKLGRKPPLLDLGLAPAKSGQSTSVNPKQP